MTAHCKRCGKFIAHRDEEPYPICGDCLQAAVDEFISSGDLSLLERIGG